MAGVYKHIRLDKNEPFYFGIFENQYRPFEKSRRNDIWDKIVAKTDYDVQIIKEGLTWEEACQMEKELIKQYGRIDKGTGILANLTDGGDGTVGLIRTEEHCNKISQSQVGKTYSNNTKKKISLGMKEYAKTNPPWNKGLLTPQHVKDKQSVSAKNRDKPTKETLEKRGKSISLAKTGIKYDSIECPHCGLIGGVNAMKRYHLDNCKKNV